MNSTENRIKEIQARDLCAKAYEAQMVGNLEQALQMYQKSIDLFPTTEAHTYLGWTLSFMGRYEEAIDQCKTAIAIDPEFGNPWNDIGAYLIELGREDEAIPYLEKATQVKRYESRAFPHFNLGRIFMKRGLMNNAHTHLQKALELDSEYHPASRALQELEMQIH